MNIKNVTLSESFSEAIPNLIMQCKIPDPLIQTSVPYSAIVRVGNRSVNEGPVLPKHDLPDWFDDLVIQFYFENLFAKEHIVGSCFLMLRQIQNTNLATSSFNIKVLGCPPQKFGLNCNGTCTCKAGVQCHSFSGECLCPRGLQGETCDELSPVLDVRSPDDVYLVWGSDYELVCTSHGIAHADLQWIKAGEKLDVNTTTIPERYLPQPVNSIHHLKNVTANKINGVYTCESTNKTIAPLSVNVNVIVIKIPQPFIETSTNQSITIGENVTLTCRIRQSAGTVIWVKGQLSLNASSIINATSRIRIESNSDIGLYQLKITNVNLQDESFYRCYVGHIFTNDDLTYFESQVLVYIHPQEPFPLIRTTGQDDKLETYDVNIGDVINMKCEANLSKPAVKLSWFLDDFHVKAANEYTETEDGITYNTSIEFLKTATVADNKKTLECAAESPAIERRSSMLTLNVTYKPLVEVNPQSITTEEGEDVSFTCNSTANPMPFSYTWIIELDNGTNLVKASQNLKLNRVTTDFDNAKIKCEVENSIGRSQANVVNFTVNGPGAPLFVILPCVGSMFLFMITIFSVLVYKYRFKIRMMKVRQNVYKNTAGGGEKEFDFFIAYKSGGDDEDFVVNTLTPKLEEMGFKVCVHFKHFLPGSSIIDNITESVHNSWKTILVLSPAFLQSGWCQYEFKTACGNMLKQRVDILPIIYEEIRNLPDLDDNIRTLINTITYLNWNGGNIDEEQKIQFWKDIMKSAPRQPHMVAPQDEEMIQLVNLE
ncbi:interleukin-18 receptor 1-like isoform X2 [Anneissia japonica]|nr:interleukin-18 receptor 1-like isoform X2 [Anneissia japonica]XP_033119190.1 interleukin-18 receptor 1-like isoform X2 [Anneissia japonica]